LPCGRWFDAVRVRHADGPPLLALLDGRGGPVIEDVSRNAFVWLVAPGATRRWGHVARVNLLSTGHALEVPPASGSGCRALRWASAPDGNCLTDEWVLLNALIHLLKGRGLPHPFPPVRALRRCGCGALVVDGEAHTCGAVS
jgi:hypothetical protein